MKCSLLSSGISNNIMYKFYNPSNFLSLPGFCWFKFLKCLKNTIWIINIRHLRFEPINTWSESELFPLSNMTIKLVHWLDWWGYLFHNGWQRPDIRSYIWFLFLSSLALFLYSTFLPAWTEHLCSAIPCHQHFCN